jgi:hypothetical protein
MGFMEGNYRAEKTEGTAQTRTVNASVLFVGLNWYIDRHWALRTTHFNYDGAYERITPARLDRRDQRDYRAGTYEVNYQASAKDILALAYFDYDFDISGFMLTSQPPHKVQVLDGYPRFNNRTWSVAWRRDWTKHLFTAVQFSQADVRQSETIDDRTRQRSSDGRAVGLRLGYRL